MTTTDTTTDLQRAPLVAPSSLLFMGVRIFDCRLPDDVLPPKAPWGETLWGSERAAWALGLRTGWNGSDRPVLSIQVNSDLRADPDEYRRTARSAVREFKRLAAEFEAASARPAEKDAGGAVHYRPVAVALSNYGATILGDARDAVVEAFS